MEKGLIGLGLFFVTFACFPHVTHCPWVLQPSPKNLQLVGLGELSFCINSATDSQPVQGSSSWDRHPCNPELDKHEKMVRLARTHK